MPRNGSGTYSLPSGNPVVTNTLITSTWANATMSDIGAELTNSLSRSGAGGMTGPLRLADGTVGVPGLAFVSETTMGFYRVAAATLGLSIAGTQVEQWTSTQMSLFLDMAIGASKFTVAQATGNTSIAGTLGVTGAATFTASATAASLIPSGSTIPVNGMYLPAANTLGFATNTARVLSVDANGNANLGPVAPPAWSTTIFRAFTLGDNAHAAIAARRDNSNQVWITSGVYFNTAGNFIYTVTGAACSYIQQIAGGFSFSTFPSGTAGNTATATSRFAVSATGNVTIAAPDSGAALAVTSVASGTGISAGDGTVVAYVANFVGSVHRMGPSSAHSAAIVTSDTNRITVNSAGSVAINSAGSIAGNGLAVTGSAMTVAKTVAFSATPTFDANNSNYFDFGALTAAVTSMTINNPTAGQCIIIRLKQDATGGRAVTVPAGSKVSGSTSGTANQISLLSMVYNGTDARWEGAFSAWV